MLRAPTTPISTPNPITLTPSRPIRVMMSCLRAPRAMRTAISWVRRETINAITPYSPMAASRTARPANKLSSDASKRGRAARELTRSRMVWNSTGSWLSIAATSERINDSRAMGFAGVLRMNVAGAMPPSADAKLLFQSSGRLRHSW